jgi:predicted 3-demethylubiquinone-9 3-methyltransferase (glyoxalase superfamily)
MQKVTPFITFNDQAEEAVNLYVSLFKDSHVVSMNRYGEGAPFPAGTVMSASFVLAGQEYIALNGGPHFAFSEGFSLYVNCETQEEVDDLWEKLTEGGEGGRCGWLKDKFGVSWQVIPTALGEMLQDEDPEKSGNVLQAMLKMSKIDIEGLRQAYNGKTPVQV